jgi:hypothetical protein
MTQAFNLSQLANRVNTSGQLNVATGASGTLPPANGGTGLSAPGTSGNVLTSNGSAWVSQALPAGGVTSLNGQTGAITNTNLYAIGSYISGRPKNLTAYAVNSTIAGSSLWSAGVGSVYTASTINDFTFQAGGTTATSSLVNVGTWRCVSPANSSGTTAKISGLWVRIS